MAFPFIYCLLLFVFWIVYKFYSKQNISFILESFLVTVTITFYFFQSTILKSLADLLNCTKIENSMYLTNYLLEKCTENPYYEKWRDFVIVPCFSLFSLILTIWPLVYMMKNVKNLYNDQIFRKIGFLLSGYSPRFFYW